MRAQKDRSTPSLCSAPLPPLKSLADEEGRAAKLLRDQKKLYALVQYVQSADRRQFIREYFGVA